MNSIRNTGVEIFLIVICAVALSFIVNFWSNSGIALFGNWDVDGVPNAGQKESLILPEREISDLAVVRQIYGRKGFLFVDARLMETYREGHIKGAVSMPLNEFDAQIDLFLSQYPTETTIITYCSGRTCEDSHILASYLSNYGYKNVKVFIDGYPAWKEANFPIE